MKMNVTIKGWYEANPENYPTPNPEDWVKVDYPAAESGEVIEWLYDLDVKIVPEVQS